MTDEALGIKSAAQRQINKLRKLMGADGGGEAYELYGKHCMDPRGAGSVLGEAPGKAVASAAEVCAEPKGDESTGGRRRRGRGVGWRFFLALLTAVVGEVGIVWSEDRLCGEGN